MVSYKVCDDDLKYMMKSRNRKNLQLQNIWGRQIYIQNHIQGCAFEHHF